MTDLPRRLVDGEMVALSVEEYAAKIAEDEAVEQSRLSALKQERTEQLNAEANRRVLNVMPDIEKALAIRDFQSVLAVQVRAKRAINTLLSLDITAGWPD